MTFSNYKSSLVATWLYWAPICYHHLNTIFCSAHWCVRICLSNKLPSKTEEGCLSIHHCVGHEYFNQAMHCRPDNVKEIYSYLHILCILVKYEDKGMKRQIPPRPSTKGMGRGLNKYNTEIKTTVDLKYSYKTSNRRPNGTQMYIFFFI